MPVGARNHRPPGYPARSPVDERGDCSSACRFALGLGVLTSALSALLVAPAADHSPVIDSVGASNRPCDDVVRFGTVRLSPVLVVEFDLTEWAPRYASFPAGAEYGRPPALVAGCSSSRSCHRPSARWSGSLVLSASAFPARLSFPLWGRASRRRGVGGGAGLGTERTRWGGLAVCWES